LNNNARIAISAIAGVAGLVSVFVYMHKRRKIPKLSFDGYFKFDKPTGNVPNKVTVYCIRIEDTNTQSEGKIHLCAGSLTVNGNVYRTVWLNNGSRYHTFAKEALLKLFEVDWSDNLIGFFNTLGETNAETVLASYPERIHSNINLALESVKGHCPRSIIMNIDDIINNAEILPI
jgi:hypothetical protein